MAGAANTFEGGTNTTAISTGNSGGTSGNAFSLAENVTFSTTRAAHGLLSARMPAESGPTRASLGYDLSGNGTRWMRGYFYSASWASDPTLMLLFTADFYSFEVQLTATQARVNVYNGTSTATTATISAAPAVNQWIRVELQANNTTGAAELRLYNTADSSTATGTATGTRTIPASAWGGATWTNIGAAETYADDVGWSDEGWLGPAVSAASLRPIIGASVAVHRAASW
ncbi:hypothetical protein ACFQVD_26425 [Streptosporangium amethystogenes subsp. fukuiense]|uniref:Uncharacterized protein n=1 Tax=Streptosporangium amethystogenes subsp. fukuiense TaxID=698418 RepID=A0ABW2T7F1_9ACTN